VYSYSTLFVVPHTQGAQARITQCYLQLHQCLRLPRKRSADGASPAWGCGHLIAAFIHPKRMKAESVSRPGWLTYSGRFIDINGHPSAAGRSQDRESLPVKDQRSTTVPSNQAKQLLSTWVKTGLFNEDGGPSWWRRHLLLLILWHWEECHGLTAIHSCLHKLQGGC